jgi:WD40 repeat protein
MVFSVSFSPDGMKVASGSGDNKIKIWNLYNEQDKNALEILNSKWILNPSQKLLLYVLYCNHQNLNSREGIDLTQTEQQLKKEYKGNPPELLNLKQSYDSLPPELKRLVEFSFDVIA